MLFQDSIKIKAPATRIFQFFEEMETNYTRWHPDHILFRWEKGRGVQEGNVFYFEETIGGEHLKKRVVFTKVIPNQYMEFAPTHWFFRLFLPSLSFKIEAQGDHCLFQAAFTVRGMGPISKRLHRQQFINVRQHMKEEGENLKRLMEQ